MTPTAKTRLACLCLLAAAVPAWTARAAPLSAQKFVEQLHVADTDEAARPQIIHDLSTYVRGAVEGIVAYHRALEAAGKTPLFCPKPGKQHSLDMRQLADMMQKAAARDPEALATSALIDYMKDLNPCPAAQSR